MDRRERFEHAGETLRAALDGRQREIWTGFPAVITAYCPATQSCDCQPALQVPLLNPDDGSIKMVNLPKLLDVPVEFPGGGGFTLSFPVAIGDECYVKIANHCIDAWWAYGCPTNTQGNPTPQVQMELRMHDLSDGVAMVGIKSQPNVFGNLSTTSCQLRSKDGLTVIDMKAGHVTIIAASAINLQGAAGDTLHKLVKDTFITMFNAHIHSGVTAGSGVTGAPTVPSTTDVTAILGAE